MARINDAAARALTVDLLERAGKDANLSCAILQAAAAVLASTANAQPFDPGAALQQLLGEFEAEARADFARLQLAGAGR